MLLLVNFSRVFQVVSAVIYVHDQGLIHRDLKPSNVLFSLDGTVKVGDFGLVTDAHSVYDDVAVLDVNLATSRHTEKVGTRMYMAPEQVTLWFQPVEAETCCTWLVSRNAASDPWPPPGALDLLVAIRSRNAFVPIEDADCLTKHAVTSEKTMSRRDFLNRVFVNFDVQMNSSNYSEKVDIYALGLILFELVHTFGTQMERVMHLTNARKLKFPVTFRRTSPLEVIWYSAWTGDFRRYRSWNICVANHATFEHTVSSLTSVALDEYRISIPWLIDKYKHCTLVEACRECKDNHVNATQSRRDSQPPSIGLSHVQTKQPCLLGQLRLTSR